MSGLKAVSPLPVTCHLSPTTCNLASVVDLHIDKVYAGLGPGMVRCRVPLLRRFRSCGHSTRS